MIELNSVDQLEDALGQFYSTTDSGLRQTIHEALLAARSKPEAWQWSLELIHPSKNPIARHFGVSCLHEKATKHWEECLSVSGGSEQVKNLLLRTIREEDSDSAVNQKLCAVLAVVALQSVPDIWPSPITDLSDPNTGLPSLSLLRTISAFASERNNLKVPLERRNLVLTVLNQQATGVQKIISQLESSARLSREHKYSWAVINAAVDCIEAWMALPNTKICDWHEDISNCLQWIEREECRDKITDFFSSLAENENLALGWTTRSDDQLLTYLFKYAADVLKPMLATTYEENQDDTGRDGLIKAIVALCEGQTRFFVSKLLYPENDTLLAALSTIAQLLLFVTGHPGQFPVDEDVSELTSNFWYLLQEDATAVGTNRSEAELTHSREILRPLYRELLQKTIPKLKLPNAHEASSKFSREDFDSLHGYRATMGDVILSCYRVLVNEAIEYLLTELSKPETEWEATEGKVFALKAIAEYVPAENPSAISFLRQAPTLFALPQPDELSNTVISCIDAFNHSILTSDQCSELLPKTVFFLAGHLSDLKTAGSATLALKHLLADRHQSLKAVPSDLPKVFYDCFLNSAQSEQTRLRALECLGYLLSLQGEAEVLSILDQLLGPRLQRLDTVCKEGHPIEKPELLFELQIVSTLVGTLQNPNESPIGKPPVLMVLEKSLPLFESLVSLSAMDEDVIDKICDCIRRGVTSLMDQAAPLIPYLCSILSPMYPPHSAVFSPAKQLHLLFAGAPELLPSLQSLTENWIQKSLLLPEDYDFEQFIGFMAQLAKKQWEYFESLKYLDGLVKIAADVIRVARESPAVKQASLLLCVLLKHPESPKLAEAFHGNKQTLITACVKRIQEETLTSAVEFTADVLQCLTETFPLEIREALSGGLGNPVLDTLLSGMLNHVKNKRKFREFAKRINNESSKMQKAGWGQS